MLVTEITTALVVQNKGEFERYSPVPFLRVETFNRAVDKLKVLALADNCAIPIRWGGSDGTSWRSAQCREGASIPVVVNTSFKVRGEPIVSMPEDASCCFMGTGIEVLGVGNGLLRKEL